MTWVSPLGGFAPVADEEFRDPRPAALCGVLENPGRGGLGARRVLDIGCGTGVFALRPAGLGIEVVAVDPARAALDVARAEPGRAGPVDPR
ncbi:Methyltransferase domain-containing protein [Actinacidiphila glaucinigra]|uniref:Methyltransferase domain-containing protein n=1 Tax=Actinacidiphila glaucinigra TaxID=235986 RepID=A0A239DVP7_9ACTN|nr:Methyltransferase domain-containing protein [Actinacidiphila glaucinigra]